MKVEEIYLKFQIELDSTFETYKIAVDRGRFCYFYNKSTLKFIENIIDRGMNDEIRYLEKVLVKDFKIPKNTSSKTADYFELPKNYFELSSVYAEASYKNCKNKIITLSEIKDANSSTILDDEFNKPSFFYRQSPFIISENNLVVFKDDFIVDDVYLSYYKYPIKIELVNPENPESDFKTIEVEFDDKVINRIVSLMVSEVKITNSDQTFQINKQQYLNKL